MIDKIDKLDIELVGILTMNLIEKNQRYKKQYDHYLEEMIDQGEIMRKKYQLPSRALDNFMSSGYASFFIAMAFRAGQRLPVKRVKMIKPQNYRRAK